MMLILINASAHAHIDAKPIVMDSYKDKDIDNVEIY